MLCRTWRTVVVLASSACLVGCQGYVGELGQAEVLPQAEPPPVPGQSPVISRFACEPSAGNLPFEVTCRWEVSDPQGAPVRCTFDADGNGVAEQSIADCLTVTSITHRFAAAGVFTARLVAENDRARASDIVVVLVSDRPNLPPEITAFDARPAVGTAPLTTTLSWSVSDPEGGPLTCEIDLFADGVAEHVLSPCTSASSQRVTFADPGAVDVVLSAIDAVGQRVSQALIVTARAPVGDLSISKVEWGQSVISSTPRLVEGKPALLRIHALGDRANIAGVAVRAEGFRNGVSLGTVSLTGPASPPTAEVPGTLAQQYRGTVPDTWVAPNLEVRVEVDPGDTLAETDETNNTLTVQPTVGAGNEVFITLVPVVHAGQPARLNLNVDEAMRQLWPVKRAPTQTRAPYTFGGTLGATSATVWAQLLGELAQVRQADGSRRYYYGLVRVGYSNGIAGIGYLGQPAAVGRDDSIETAVHEVGHNMNRAHAPCGNPDQPDPSFPYASARLGSFGYDFVSGALIAPTAAYDVMSYCSPEWVSDFNYRAVQTFLEQNPPSSVGAPPQADVLMFSGRVSATRVELGPVQRVLGTPSVPRDGPYTLRVTSMGRVVEAPFDVTPVEDLGVEEAHFTVLMPDVGTLESVEVLSGSRVLARRAAAAVVPQNDIRLTERDNALQVEWDAVHHPYALVAHLGDGERTTLAVRLEGGRAVVRTDGLPAGGAFEISVSDGMNTVRRVVDR
ncbi:MAG: M66 family metalloprotease [Myxococcota bacterium]